MLDRCGRDCVRLANADGSAWHCELEKPTKPKTLPSRSDVKSKPCIRHSELGKVRSTEQLMHPKASIVWQASNGLSFLRAHSKLPLETMATWFEALSRPMAACAFDASHAQSRPRASRSEQGEFLGGGLAASRRYERLSLPDIRIWMVTLWCAYLQLGSKTYTKWFEARTSANSLTDRLDKQPELLDGRSED